MPYAAVWLQRWNALPKGTRRVAGAVGLLAIVLAVVLGVVAHPARTALFPAPLHPEQLAEVEERLAGWNIAFVPVADNVVVDTSRRNDLLLRLSLAGVPHPHLETSGEALANVGVLTPQEVIDAQTRAGLAGDIEAGLRGIDGIDDARVIVAPAKVPTFADDSARGASASVRVSMRGARTLSRAAVAGIRAFVAASVVGLDPAHVTILDDRGIALGQSDEGDDATDLQQTLQSALDDAFGAGAAIVRVRAEYRTDGLTERDVRRVPLGFGAISRTAHAESYDDGAKRYRRDDESDDRGSETQERLSQARAGGLERLSAAVFVDESRGIDVVKVRDLAAAAIGYDARRGDTLAVQAVDFRRAPAARKDAWWLLYGAFVPAVPALIVAAGLLLAARGALPVLVKLVEPMLRRAALERTSKAASGVAPSHVRTLLANEPAHAAAAVISALPAATAAAVLDLYPQHEREAIVRRMQRPHCPLLDDAEELLRHHA